MYNILIADDEHLSRNLLKDMVLEIEPDATIFLARSAREAAKILDSEAVDIFFSDIKMPGETGMDLIKSMPERGFDLVFVTAYKDYAIDAIKNGAIDYLLKPVSEEEFRKAFQKIRQRRDNFDKNQQPKDYLSGKLVVSHQQGVKFVVLRDIIYLQADNTYTTIYLDGGEKIMVSRPISKFEEKLAPEWFYRIHKSHIVNVLHFKEYLSKDRDLALMDNGDVLPISRYRVQEFLATVKNMPGRINL